MVGPVRDNPMTKPQTTLPKLKRTLSPTINWLWRPFVLCLLIENGGTASLEQIYATAARYKSPDDRSNASVTILQILQQNPEVFVLTEKGEWSLFAFRVLKAV